MPLGTKVNLGPLDVVLGVVAAPSPLKGAHPLSFQLSIVAKRLDG